MTANDQRERTGLTLRLSFASDGRRATLPDAIDFLHPSAVTSVVDEAGDLVVGESHTGQHPLDVLEDNLARLLLRGFTQLLRGDLGAKAISDAVSNALNSLKRVLHHVHVVSEVVAAIDQVGAALVSSVQRRVDLPSQARCEVVHLAAVVERARQLQLPLEGSLLSLQSQNLQERVRHLTRSAPCPEDRAPEISVRFESANGDEPWVGPFDCSVRDQPVGELLDRDGVSHDKFSMRSMERSARSILARSTPVLPTGATPRRRPR